MSDMKCPKCGGRLVYWGATDTEIKFDCKHYASEALDEINNIDKGE